MTKALGLYGEVNTRALYYHNRIWETAKFYFWAYTVPLSAAFTLFSWRTSSSEPDDPVAAATFDIAVLLLTFGAERIARYGRRVLIQERMLFAYELEVRRSIERALGWKIEHPQIVKLHRSWRRPVSHTVDVRTTTFNYEAPSQSGIDTDELQFVGPQLGRVSSAGEKRVGAFGLFFRLFVFAQAVAVMAEIGFGYFVMREYTVWRRFTDTVQVVERLVNMASTDEEARKGAEQRNQNEDVGSARNGAEQHTPNGAAGVQRNVPNGTVGRTVPTGRR